MCTHSYTYRGRNSVHRDNTVVKIIIILDGVLKHNLIHNNILVYIIIMIVIICACRMVHTLYFAFTVFGGRKY